MLSGPPMKEVEYAMTAAYILASFASISFEPTNKTKCIEVGVFTVDVVIHIQAPLSIHTDESCQGAYIGNQRMWPLREDPMWNYNY